MKSERIIRRVKGLLRLADDNSNVEESHSAFLQAQAMMVKYGVDPSEVTDNDEIKEVLERSGTEYKRLYWYERELAYIVANNFPCNMIGFIDGLERKFEEQIKVQEWGLVLATPKEVEEKYDDLVTGKLNHNVPQLASQKTYQQGFKDGNGIDYKKETIKGEVEYV